jgi:hypothetical protein
MENRRWVVRITGAGVWVLAALTWGSIGHHLFGLPDLGPGVAVLAVVFLLAWPRPGALRALHSVKSPGLVDKGHPSRP